MPLKTLSNSELLSRLKSLVSKEREILTEILHHLLEVEDRKLHLEEGYGSLFQYAVEALGYSESQAYRRISAMRVLRELPEIEQPLKEGSLNLTHITQAREYFKSGDKKSKSLVSDLATQHAFTREEKLNVLHSLENKSTRETEKIFAGLAPNQIPADKERQIREDLTEIRFVASSALLEKLNRFKELDSHVQKDPNYAELIERLVDLALKQREKVSDAVGKVSAPKNSLPENKLNNNLSKKRNSKLDKKPIGVNEDLEEKNMKERSRAIPVFVKKIVIVRDQGSCCFTNPITGKRCGSKYRLQFDHRIPFAKDGENSAENIRLLCQSHNLLLAEKYFGKEKVRRHQNLH